MNLVMEVRLKNDQLALQRIALQQQIDMRISSLSFKSFWISLVLEPFILGSIAQRFLGRNGLTVRRLLRLVLPSVGLWSIF